MADADSVTKGAGNFLARKVGPLPLGIWLVAAAGIYYYYSRKQAGAAAGTGTSTPGSQTDPAGNVGYIDPSTGYVYGSPEDTAALQQASQNSTSGSGASTSSSVGTTYDTNDAWGRAAVNYLVGLGVDATTANQAITLYLSSQPLTANQQADVNLAIQALGAPPSLPGPANSNPPPVTTPPGGGSGGGGGGSGGGGGGGGTVTVPNVKGKSVSAADAAITAAGLVPGAHSTQTGTVNGQTPGPGAKVAKGSTVDLSVAASSGGSGGGSGGGTGKSVGVPTGFTVSSKTASSLRVSWKRVNGATGYHLAVAEMGSSARSDQDVGADASTATFGNLKAGGKYVVDLWAEPEGGPKGSGPHAHVSTQLPAR